MYFLLAAVGAVLSIYCARKGLHSVSDRGIYEEAQRDRVRRLSQRGDFPHESYE